MLTLIFFTVHLNGFNSLMCGMMYLFSLYLLAVLLFYVYDLGWHWSNKNLKPHNLSCIVVNMVVSSGAEKRNGKTYFERLVYM